MSWCIEEFYDIFLGYRQTAKIENHCSRPKPVYHDADNRTVAEVIR